MYTIHTVLFIFPKVLTGINCLAIKSFLWLVIVSFILVTVIVILYKVFLTLKSVYQNFFFLIFIFILFYILYLHKYLPNTYFLHDAYPKLTFTTYNTYITIQLHQSN